jgi:hypothetical protein
VDYLLQNGSLKHPNVTFFVYGAIVKRTDYLYLIIFLSYFDVFFLF